MTETDTELDDAFEEATTAAERAHEDADGDSLPDEHRDELRESAERLAATVSEASLGELLDAAGFDDVPDDVSPVDLREVIRDADPAAIVDLRTLLQLADLGESWSELSDEERIDRVNGVVGDESEGGGGFAQLKEYLDQFGHVVGDGEESDAADGDADGESPSDDETDSDATDGDDGADDDLLQLEENLDRLKQLVGGDDSGGGGADAEPADADADDEAVEADAEAAEADAEAADADAEADEDDRRPSKSGSATLFSTVPSTRSDTGSATRFSTMRGRK